MGCANKLDALMRHKVAVIVGWQFCALAVCGAASLCAAISQRKGYCLNFFMTASGYSLLFLLTIWIYPKPKTKWWGYILAAITAFAGDTSAITSLSHTSLATSTLITSTNVFWCVPLGYIVFKRKITIWQGFAILLAIGGGAVLIVGEGVSGNKWVGDLIAFAASILYAMTGVTQDYLNHHDSPKVYYVRFGACAAPLSWILSGALEWKKIRDYQWDWQTGVLYASYAVCLTLFCLLSPFVMQYSDATTFGMSMLTANFYTLGVSVIAFHQKANWIYLVGFCCIPLAIAIFTLSGPKETVPVETADPILFDPETQQSLLSDQLSAFTDGDIA